MEHERMSYVFDPFEPYDVPENAYRTDGRGVCHWCASRPQEYLWGPFKTRTCGYCEELIDAGRHVEIVDEVWARMKIKEDGVIPKMIDLDRWHIRETALIERWLEMRTTREPLTPSPED